MPITSQGDQGIFDSLNHLKQKLDSPAVVSELAHTAVLELAETTPIGQYGRAGLLLQTMTAQAMPERTEGGWWAGVGNLAGIYPLKAAPRGTIKAFLELIRGAKKTTGEPRKKFFDEKRAWWFLKEREKQQLREMREAGVASVGGISPYKPMYWFIQEKGMEEVGIHAQNYIKTAVDAIKGQIGGIIERILRSV